MPSFLRPAALLAATLVCLTATARAGVVDLPQYGIRMDLLDGTPTAAPNTVLMTFLPLTDGFSPNINVQIQPYEGTAATYAEVSKKEFIQANIMVLGDALRSPNEWVVEYTGQMQEVDLHFYARAVAKGGKIYLITGTAKKLQWDTVGPTLKKSVDSFQLR